MSPVTFSRAAVFGRIRRLHEVVPAHMALHGLAVDTRSYYGPTNPMAGDSRVNDRSAAAEFQGCVEHRQ